MTKPVEITIPRLGWSMDEGTFGEWVKQDGEFVAAGDPIFLLETEKALQEVESVDAGVLHILPDAPRPGETVTVGRLIGYLLAAGEAPPTVEPGSHRSHVAPSAVSDSSAQRHRTRPTAAPTAAEAHTPAVTAVAAPSVRRLARTLGVDLGSLECRTASESDVLRAAAAADLSVAHLRRPASDVPARNAAAALPRISPRAARTARRRGIDWTLLKGTGRNGRIRERDVPEAAEPDAQIRGTLKPASAVRRLIAQRMAQSRNTTVPVTLSTVVDIDAVVRHRELSKQQAVLEGTVAPAVHDYVMLVAAAALKPFPELNSRWRDGQILQPDGIHIGLAVDTEAGLVVPVVHHAGGKSLHELAGVSRELIRRAAERRLVAEEMTGGTFTISNLGAFGIDAFTPVINPGESAILGIGAIRKVPVFADDGNVVPSSQMTLSLTFDHQVTDGAPAARFLKWIAASLTSFPEYPPETGT